MTQLPGVFFRFLPRLRRPPECTRFYVLGNVDKTSVERAGPAFAVFGESVK